MTNTYNTLNPLGSVSAKDLSDNASNFDEGMNSPSPSFYDRFSRRRQTWSGMEAIVADALQNQGFEATHLTYVNGSPLIVLRPTQLIDRGGSVYKIKSPATFPFTLTGTFATDAPNMVDVGDASVRSDLADPSVVTNGDARIAVRKIAAGLTAIDRTQHGVNEETVTLSDFADIPDAIAWAMSAGGRRCIVLPGGELDMTGKQFLLPNTPAGVATSPLYFKTAGGTKIIKNDGGYLFDVDGAFFYDLIVEGLEFEGVVGAGCILFNTDKIIRLTVENCHSKFIDYYMKGSSYCQTVRMINNTQRVGQAFCDHPYGFDVWIAGNIIEHGSAGILFTRSSGDYALLGATIQSNVIEGLDGVGIQLGACAAVQVFGNYQEVNGEYSDFNASLLAHAGLQHHGNWYFMDTAQLAAGHFPVLTGNHGHVFTTGGNFSNGNLYDNSSCTSSLLNSDGGDYYLGQLYKGHTSLNDPLRDPLNGAHFFEGHKEAWCFNKNTTYIDAVTGAKGYGSATTSVIIGLQLVHPEEWHGSVNPQTTPAAYGNRAWAKGSMVINNNPVMSGTVPNRFYIEKWTCIQSSSGVAGDPGVWIEVVANSFA